MPTTLFPSAGPELRHRLEQIETIRLINGFDWSATDVGAIPEWSQSLRGAVRTIVTAATPMALMVGAKGYLIYNEAYADFAGSRHPEIFGEPAEEAWPEIAEFNRHKIELGLAGESLSLRDQELILNRHGVPESAWLDLNYSPVLGDDGASEAVLCIVHEITDRKLAEQALARSEERLSLALSGSNTIGIWDWDIERDSVTADDGFARLYGIDPLHAGLGVPVDAFTAAIHPEDRSRVLEEIDVALRTGEPYVSEYRLVTGGGDPLWVVASGRARLNADGKASRFPGVAVDITDQKRIAEALAKSDLEFRTLTNAMPQIVWATRPDGFHDYYNQRWYEFTGVPTGSTDGDGWNNIFHPDDQDLARQRWRQSVATGEPYQIEYRLRHHSGQYRWTLGRALPVRDQEGAIVRWIGTCTDIHDSKIAAEERELVAQELSHRIKNIFAVLVGLIGLSSRGRPEVKPFADELRQRIFALGEAHDFVRPHSSASHPGKDQTSLRALVERLLQAYREPDSERLRFIGDDAAIDDGAATPLALLFHELGTNSAKYGALSTPGGYVELTGRDAGDDYELIWRESGGPDLGFDAPTDGFGSRVITLAVEGQMRGEIERNWSAEGLVARITLPRTSLRRSAKLGTAN